MYYTTYKTSVKINGIKKKGFRDAHKWKKN